MNKGLASFYNLLIGLIVISAIFKFLTTVDAIYCLLVIIAFSIIEIGRDLHVQK